MPEDVLKTRDERDLAADEIAADVRELRRAVLDLGRMLKKFGKKRLDEVDADIELRTEEILQHGGRVLHDLERRLGQVEKTVERSVREHPGAWAGGLLGVIGFGLILGLLLRRSR